MLRQAHAFEAVAYGGNGFDCLAEPFQLLRQQDDSVSAFQVPGRVADHDAVCIDPFPDLILTEGGCRVRVEAGVSEYPFAVRAVTAEAASVGPGFEGLVRVQQAFGLHAFSVQVLDADAGDDFAHGVLEPGFGLFDGD